MPPRRDTAQFLDWDGPRFLYEIRRRGLTWAQIGAQADPPIKGAGVRKALQKPWPRAERVIAAALNVQVETIWPSRYPPNQQAA